MPRKALFFPSYLFFFLERLRLCLKPLLKSDMVMEKFWFMDWAGALLFYDAEKQMIFRASFSPYFAPDFFVLSASKRRFATPISFCQKDKTVDQLPKIEMDDLGTGRVGLRSLDNFCWLSSDLFGDSAAFKATELLDWEKFLPLTYENLEALSLLADEQALEILDAYDRLTPPLVFTPDGNADLGGFRFSLTHNLPAITALRTLEEGKSCHFTLRGLDMKKECFEIVKKKRP